MAALDPMFHLKNLQLEEVYSLYARRKYPGNLVIKKRATIQKISGHMTLQIGKYLK